jgi:23S rRNA (cytidine1920-2'-O)/16S rRNA (cytidine1409-2'-O)-methyltransferase
MHKQRLDTLLAERGLFSSRSRAAASVMAGEVCLGPERRRAQKPGEQVAVDVAVSVAERARFVSRGGIKLENALVGTGVAVAGRCALDVGASTGGFTDCLLQRGATEVVAVDVGYGELAYSLRTDPRVRVLERTNARGLTPEIVREALAAGRAAASEDTEGLPQGSPPDRQGLPPDGQGLPADGRGLPADGHRSCADADLPDLAVVDVSFISLTKVLPAVLDCLAPACELLALVKPQFEVGRTRVGHGGVVRSAEDRRAALTAVGLAARELGVAVLGFCSSGLPGPKGNRETFVWLARRTAPTPDGRGDGAADEADLGGVGGEMADEADPGGAGEATTTREGDASTIGAATAEDVERMAREVEP